MISLSSNGLYDRTEARSLFTPPPSDTVDARVLAAGAMEVHAIPAGAARVVFSATGDFWAKFGTLTVAAAIPSADVLDGSSAELNPAARMILAGMTHIALVAPAATSVTLAFYSA